MTGLVLIQCPRCSSRREGVLLELEDCFACGHTWWSALHVQDEQSPPATGKDRPPGYPTSEDLGTR